VLNVNKFYSPGQKNQCYLFCIVRKFVHCGKYFRSHAVPPYTRFTVFKFSFRSHTHRWNFSSSLYPQTCLCIIQVLKTPWPESASELYRPSDRRLSVKLEGATQSINFICNKFNTLRPK
jgi:hypothetical protein